MLDISNAFRRAQAQTRLADAKAALRGQERRRGLTSFLTWPFFLGVIFAHDEVAAATHTDHAQPDDTTAAPGSEASPHDSNLPPGAAAVADVEPDNPSPTTYLDIIASPLGAPQIVAGDVYLVPGAEGAGHLAALSGGGGGGGGYGGADHAAWATADSADAPIGAELSPDAVSVDALAIGPLHLSLDLGPPLGDALSTVENGLNDIVGTIADLPLVGGLLGDVGHGLLSLSSSVQPQSSAGTLQATGLYESGSNLFAGSSFADTVSSAGSMVFAPSEPGSGLADLFANGRYTDYGITIKTTMTDNVSAHIGVQDYGDAAGIATLDLGHGVGSLTPSVLADHHAGDDASLRTPLDMLS